MAALDPGARYDGPGGMLWFPRRLQGAGRHDNPELYGCLYVAAEPVGAVAETLAPFRGSGRLIAAMLRRAGRPLHLGRFALSDDAVIVDLDDPEVLTRERLRPSRVATGRRSITQDQAARLHRAHPEAAALRWWSTIESSLINLTIFERGARLLHLEETQELSLDHPAVSAAGELLGLL